MAQRIQILDTTLRDGEQVPGSQLKTEEKVIIARELELLGVDVIEAGFPISSPCDFLSVVEISKSLKEPIICGLARAKKDDIDAAANALSCAKRGRIHTGIGSSDIHIRRKFKSTREKVLKQGVWAVQYAKSKNYEVAFYAEDAGRADLDFLAKMMEAVIDAGADLITIPDTTGYCLPDLYGKRIRYLFDSVRNINKVIVSIHCHNDLGLATANTLNGVLNGAKQVEVTINGVGERAGNASLEEVAMIFHVHKELGFETGIKPERIYRTSRLVSEMMRMTVQANKAIVGSNAFAHSYGVQKNGFLHHDLNYEILDPSEVGVHPSTIVLSARSSRAGLKNRLSLLGHQFDGEILNKLYENFLSLAHEKQDVNDDDLHILVANLPILQ